MCFWIAQFDHLTGFAVKKFYDESGLHLEKSEKLDV